MAVKKRINEGGAEAVACAHGGHHLRLYRIAAEHTGGFAIKHCRAVGSAGKQDKAEVIKAAGKGRKGGLCLQGGIGDAGHIQRAQNLGQLLKTDFCNVGIFKAEPNYIAAVIRGAKIKVAEFKAGYAGKQLPQGSGVAPLPQSKGAEIENIAAGIVNALSGYAVVGGIGNEIVFRHGIAVKGYIAAPGFPAGQDGTKRVSTESL